MHGHVATRSFRSDEKDGSGLIATPANNAAAMIRDLDRTGNT